jgi:hypothetical protein
MRNRESTFSPVIAVIAGTTFVFAVSAQVKLPSGEWMIESRVEGAPGSPEPMAYRTCLSEDALGQPEPAFFDAVATLNSTKRGTLKCKFGSIARNGGQSSWNSECDSPFGVAPATGSATLDAGGGQLRQSMTLTTPLGARIITQIVTVKHAGACVKK